jgi:electron transfer flavoprotein alpha subunit
MATVRGLLPGAAAGPINLPSPKVTAAKAPEQGFKFRVLSRKPLEAVDDLQQASIVVAVGLGVSNPEGVAKAAEFASKIGAALGGTRAAVDRGWLPPERQIGLSGRSVTAKLLLTLGVSGSVQFMAGAGGVKRLIAINNDPQAPIFSYAQTGIVLDIDLLWPHLEAVFQ